jgi:hypothetical protein
MLRRLQSLGFFSGSLIGLMAFVGLAYLLENWTGAMALEAARARVFAAGETLDYFTDPNATQPELEKLEGSNAGSLGRNPSPDLSSQSAKLHSCSFTSSRQLQRCGLRRW